MKYLFKPFLFFFVPFVLVLGVQVSGISQDKPNIIVIFTDDHGYADLGVQKQDKDIRTPHIDALAKSGIRMTAGYVTGPQCVPSRAGLMAGRYQQRFGVDDNRTIPMPLAEVLIPQRLQAAGYKTGMVGKWHLDPSSAHTEWIKQNASDPTKEKRTLNNVASSILDKYKPVNRGFQDCWDGLMGQYEANFNLLGEDIPLQTVTDNRFRVDVQTEAALAFVQRNKAKPFFLYLAYYAPHVPLEAPDKYLNRFPETLPKSRRMALAMLSAVDDGVGKLMESLEKNSIRKNTLIFFISDNGAPLGLARGSKLDDPQNRTWDGSLNTPWIGEKGMVSEGGIRVPYLISWPAVLAANKVYSRPVSSLDVAATALAVAGLPTASELDGVNIIPFLTGKQKGEPHEALYWRFWNQSAIRMGDWKYIKAGEKEFLFHLKPKTHETRNRIHQHPEVAQKMRLKLEEWAKDMYTPGLPPGPMNKDKNWYEYYFE